MNAPVPEATVDESLDIAKNAYTGEFFISGQSSKRMVEDVNARYACAAEYVAGKTVLDCACGSGYGSLYLAKAGAKKVIGMDISPSALEVASKYHPHPNVTYQQGSILAIPYKDTFDVIMCSETIEHISEYMEALRQIFGALKPGGILVLTTPNRPVTTPSAKHLSDPIPYEFHTQEFTADEMTQCLKEAGFDADITVLGHRQQFLFPTRLLSHMYKKLCDPNHRTSPNYEPKKPWKHPRNLIFIARKKA